MTTRILKRGDETVAHDFRRHRIGPVAGGRKLGFQRGSGRN
jgi:hypothetical protein